MLSEIKFYILDTILHAQTCQNVKSAILTTSAVNMILVKIADFTFRHVWAYKMVSNMQNLISDNIL